MLMFRHVVSSEQTIFGSIVSLPPNVLAGIETGQWEKFAITAKHSVGPEEEMTPSMSNSLSGYDERILLILGKRV